MIRSLMMGALAWFLAGGIAFAQDAATPDTSAQNSVNLARVLVDMPTGTPWMFVKIDTLFCLRNPVTRTWPGGRLTESLPPYSASFKSELERAGYKVITPGEDNLFDPESGAADYAVAAVITDEHVDGSANDGTYFTDRGSVRGRAT
jgi:hypothetical protein